MPHRYGRLAAVVSCATALAAGCFLHGASGAARAEKSPAATALRVAVVDLPWTTLDPAINVNDPLDVDYLNAVYGQLFELGPGDSIVPDEASGYAFSNHNKTVTITIRAGVRFSDGQPLTAADVAWSINRDVSPQYGNVADPEFPLASPATASGNKVVLNLAQSDTAIIPAFIGSAPNYTVDRTAFESESAAVYGQNPIGAGPFIVASDVPGSELVLKRNPTYWKRNHPLLTSIDFRSYGDDQGAIAALRNGSEDVALGITSVPLIKKAPSEGLQVTQLPAVADEFITLNTATPPFNNPLAREAVAAATNGRAIVANLFGGEYTTVQAETGPGQEYYVRSDKAYQGYDLTKARQLVQRLGGLTVSLATSTGTEAMTNEVSAVAAMWEAAGISVNVLDYSPQQALSYVLDGNWQAMDQSWGPNVDPVVNDPKFFRSHWPLSGVADAKLDGMLNQAEALGSSSGQQRVLREIADYEDQQDYAIWLYAKSGVVISTSHVARNGAIAPGMLLVQWENLARR